MQHSADTIAILSHLAAMVGYAVLTLALLLHKKPSGFRLMVALASLLTALWAAAIVANAATPASPSPMLIQLGTLRTAAWIVVLLILQRRSLGLADKPTSSFLVAASLGFVVALLLVLNLGIQLSAGGNTSSSLTLLFTTCRLVLAISGLVLLHNLYVNSNNSTDLNFRMLAVGVGILFAYDLNYYTLQFLTGQPNIALYNLRGAAFTLAIPLIYFGMRGDNGGRFTLSRRAAFHTVSFTIIGIYLILMSLLSYGLRLTGGSWGQLWQIAFLTVTLALGALVVLSPRFRAELRMRINRNFYRYRYDYRVEWLRFIDQIDASSETIAPFRERLIQAFATVLDCPGGALLEPGDDGNFHLTTRWFWPALPPLPPLPDNAPVIRHLQSKGLVVDFDRLRAGQAPLYTTDDADTAGPMLLDIAMSERSIWLAVPVIHRQQLRGVLLLERSIAPRELNWEDFELLRTLGRQGASYLAEADTLAQLDEVRSFDEYNRRFAFVMHDVKNVVSQLALVARNAERHADNPAFRADMTATLHSSVAKMTDLLSLMGGKSGQAASRPVEHETDLAALLAAVVATLRRQHGAITLSGTASPLLLKADRQRLEAMFTHLIQNAIDASAPDAPIEVVIAQDGPMFVVTVRDQGHGMSPAFIRDELFKPFRSTKESGFGIGAFDAREIARTHGGRLEVESQPGEGSTFTISLPAQPPARQRRAPGTAKEKTAP